MREETGHERIAGSIGWATVLLIVALWLHSCDQSRGLSRIADALDRAHPKPAAAEVQK